jgi:hypothetical protein
MAHREQHGNREAKKPRKDQGSRSAEPKKWDVTEIVEAKSTAKHQTVSPRKRVPQDTIRAGKPPVRVFGCGAPFRASSGADDVLVGQSRL